MSVMASFFSAASTFGNILALDVKKSPKYLLYSPVSELSNFTIIGSSGMASTSVFIRFLSPSLYFLILHLSPGLVLLSLVAKNGPSQRYTGSPDPAPIDGQT